MDDNKQQIIHYFIEEAQEHLVTVEQGLLDLAEVISDAERVNEMFRAAHSIKGGAAMLGFEGIQATAHKLEDCFKILRDHPVPIDRKLETLFLGGYDALKALVEELANSPTLSLRPEVVTSVLSGSAANFVALEEYLEEMLNINTHDTAGRETPVAATVGGSTAVMAPPINIVAIVTTTLQQMLGLFKQGDNPANRQQLVGIAQSLSSIRPDAGNWQALIRTTAQAIANPHNTYNAVAPLVIRELKQAGDLLAAGREREIVVSVGLQQAISTAAPIAPIAPAVPTPTAPAVAQITIPVDVRGAAQGILQNFNRQQVTELVVLLHRVISNSKQN
ncbi:Hpt domain-containing protein [Chamaesiphon sp. GL140_3_metabinner_50]|uniref:Hpt domain-containing protein n=1 Tax=Chamaesiphon sp. GL140_3_metabinner_50 TaxID=2970812 RepID=UPI0025E36A33|nr:Hpt domain-containing protein [Chamaesiphon sp. GL140_3_metabinner_50]